LYNNIASPHPLALCAFNFNWIHGYSWGYLVNKTTSTPL
jgi:hypothetical protein